MTHEAVCLTQQKEAGLASGLPGKFLSSAGENTKFPGLGLLAPNSLPANREDLL
jgi:hypothetical protein